MKRRSITHLNGTWQMQPEGTGLDRPGGDRWVDVPVPMPWSALYDERFGVPIDLVPDRMAWFRRTVACPPVPPLHRPVLHFEAVNFHAVVFADGERCGEHSGDAVPFDVDLAGFVTPGEPADLLVGVADISQAGADRTGGPKLLYPGLSHHPGMWGDVWLWLRPELHIASVNVRTRLPERGPGMGDTDVHLTVTVKNQTARTLGFTLTNEVYRGPRQELGFAPVRAALEPGESKEFRMSARWESPKLWWPDAPHRYVLRSALWSTLDSRQVGGAPGDVVDRLDTAFGVREFRIEGRQFLLNRVPIQLRSESASPISGRLIGELEPGEPDCPIEPDQAVRTLAMLKEERKLNTVRFHRVPPARALLDAADRVGLLAVVEFPLPDDQRHYAVTEPAFWEHAEGLAREWVGANAHHPAVVLWSVDQGMIRRYGPEAISGLRSLARTVAEADPTRPIEHSGDGAAVAAGDLDADSPVSVFFPRVGAALRSAEPYIPDDVRGRELPLPRQLAGHWLPARPSDRPLCLTEHARRPGNPNDLAYFLGDAAYVQGAAAGPEAAALATLEMGALRMAEPAGIHTIGRPPAPEVAAEPGGELVAIPATLFANAYGGTRFVARLILHNDTRHEQDVELACRFDMASGRGTGQGEEVLMPAGSRRMRTVSFDLPDIATVQDADGARSALADFQVRVRGAVAGEFESHRKLAIWPHVRASGGRRIGLIDPDGSTASALSAAGARYAAAHAGQYADFDTLILGEDALDSPPSVAPQALRSFVAEGGLAIILAQSDLPYDLSPVPLILDGERAASVGFVRDAEHHVMRGLSNFEMRWWQNDHRIAARCLRKPARGNFRCLADMGGPGGLRWTGLIEVFHGRGSYLFSQLELVHKAARAPVAGLLLARLADAVPSWRSVRTAVARDDELFRELGVRSPGLPDRFGPDDLAGVQVVLATARSVREFTSKQLGLLRRWLRHGGCLYAHGLAPGQERTFEKLTDAELTLEASLEEWLVFNRPGFGLARGLSSADLYFVDHGARYLGRVPRRIHAATVMARGRGGTKGVASSVNSPRKHALMTMKAGRGRVIVDLVRWDVDFAAEARAARYASTLLTNLGVLLEPEQTAMPSARWRPIDISAACNEGFVDPIPGDGAGWTDRGPDNDLRMFTPGVIVAGGIPFRVAKDTADITRTCCMLSGRTGGTAPPVTVGAGAEVLAFLLACEGHARPGTPIARFIIRYQGGLETQVPVRYGVEVLDWNEQGHNLENAVVAWKGRTLAGLPAATYAVKWQNNRPDATIETVTFSSTQSGVTPILLALSAIE